MIRVMRLAGGDRGAGTVAKRLAALTRSNELVNHKGKWTCRLPLWVRRHPRPFDDR